jgi:dihydroorotate dehydrogenase (fumarate)
MTDLHTRYLGLELRSPLVASSSPLTGSLDGLLRLQSAGAAAVVLPSLFEEELAGEGHADVHDAAPRTAGYGAGLAAYLALLRQAKAELSIPVIASLNGVTRGGWVRHAAGLEEAGADALELNVYYVSTSPGLSATDVERRYLDLVEAVRAAVRVPLAVKLSPYFSALANLARRLVEAGADGLVLFNRFYQPDLDVELLDVAHGIELSSPAELRLPLRWVAILHGHLGRASLAASSGVHTAEDVVKALLAGADVAMTTSALLRHGPEHLGAVEAGLRDWLGAHGHAAPAEVRGRLSQRAVRDPLAYERANYVRALGSYAAGTRDR